MLRNRTTKLQHTFLLLLVIRDVLYKGWYRFFCATLLDWFTFSVSGTEINILHVL